jgi:hypothetical protein
MASNTPLNSGTAAVNGHRYYLQDKLSPAMGSSPKCCGPLEEALPGVPQGAVAVTRG